MRWQLCGPIMLDFASNPVWLNVLLFAIAAAIVWFAGGRLERLAEAIATRTGLGHAFTGLLLLAAATSLPEVATTITAAAGGYRQMLTHNLLGGVAMQTAILVLADLFIRQAPLTRVSPSYAILMQGVAVIVLLGIAVVWIAVGDAGTMQFGPVTLAPLAPVLLLGYFLMLWATHRAQHRARWEPLVSGETGRSPTGPESGNREGEPYVGASLRRIVFTFAAFAAVVLVAGWAVAELGNAIAQQTGIASSFVGATFVATATSLPEVSVVIPAVRRANYSMAIGNVFGSNMFDVSLLAVGDIILGEPLFAAPIGSVGLAAGIGVLLTCVYLWGLLEHRDRSFLRLGIDSWVVLVVYAAGLVGLYLLGSASP